METTALHPHLKKLEEVRKLLSYADWEIDYRDAEDSYNEREYSTDFPKALRKLKVKQKLHDGDRSHPRLVALDATIRKWEEGSINIHNKLLAFYPGWEADVKQLEKMHADVPYLPRSDIAFNSKLRALDFSQRMYEQTGEVVDHGQQEQEKTPDAATLRATNAAEASSPLGLCTICGDETKSTAFIPCGHLCTCESCAKKVMRRNSRCVICRCNAVDTVQIYL